jgi:hypothetical protein
VSARQSSTAKSGYQKYWKSNKRCEYSFRTSSKKLAPDARDPAWEQYRPLSLAPGRRKGNPVMASSQLKRTERAIAMMRREGGLPREAADALQELVDVVRALEGRLAMLEAKRRPSPTAEMDLPNRS